MISTIHGPTGKLGDGPKEGVWGKIAHVYRAIDKANISLPCLFCRKLGNGRNTKFWLDPWCGNKPLVNHFPRLAVLDRDKDCLVADRMVISKDGGFSGWNWQLLRPLRRDHEVCQLQLQQLASLCEFSLSEDLDGKDDRWT